MTRASRFLAALDACLPPERLQHGRVERMAETIPDATSGIGRPYVSEGLLAMLERRGAIGPRERMAGEEFGKLFSLAALDPLKSADLGQRFGQVSYGPHPSEWARRKITRCFDALGGTSSPVCSIAWHCLGLQGSLRSWSVRQGWSGRPVSPHVARGLLLAALSILRHHFKL